VLLKLKCEEPLSIFAFKFNLRRYNLVLDDDRWRWRHSVSYWVCICFILGETRSNGDVDCQTVCSYCFFTHLPNTSPGATWS